MTLFNRKTTKPTAEALRELSSSEIVRISGGATESSGGGSGTTTGSTGGPTVAGHVKLK